MGTSCSLPTPAHSLCTQCGTVRPVQYSDCHLSSEHTLGLFLSSQALTSQPLPLEDVSRNPLFSNRNGLITCRLFETYSFCSMMYCVHNQIVSRVHSTAPPTCLMLDIPFKLINFFVHCFVWRVGGLICSALIEEKASWPRTHQRPLYQIKGSLPNAPGQSVLDIF